MAVVSSHTLNGVDGSHAGGIPIRLVNLDSGQIIFDTRMDDSGRLKQKIGVPDPKARYELVFLTGVYWEGRSAGTCGARIVDEIVVRFTMPDPDGYYHIPLILSPHGYSLWSSTEHG
ncbi:MAG: hydroxyisourate hydrolase [Acidiferrobacterales bacterium]|nr:hydroxyisourate hydrolase [Acidiferrobacterales bacterium]